MQTIDRIHIHIKQTQHDILKETLKKKTVNMFNIAKKWGGGALLIIYASLSLFNESSNFQTSKLKLLSSVIINKDNFCSLHMLVFGTPRV